MRRTALFLLVSTTPWACGGHRPRIEPAIFPVAIEWVAQVGDPFEGAAIQPPLATDGTRVFVATADGAVRGLDGGTGGERWIVPNRPGVLSARSGMLVVREADGTVWSVAPGSGSARWKAETGVAGRLPAGLGEDAIFVGGQGCGPRARGAVRWTRSRPRPPGRAPPCLGKRPSFPGRTAA